MTFGSSDRSCIELHFECVCSGFVGVHVENVPLKIFAAPWNIDVAER